MGHFWFLKCQLFCLTSDCQGFDEKPPERHVAEHPTLCIAPGFAGRATVASPEANRCEMLNSDRQLTVRPAMSRICLVYPEGNRSHKI